MKVPVKQAVFPVAGLGTRFLPATKANPKEMLPIVDKPLIQYAVEEAVDAGIDKLIFVTSSSKRAIEDHFDLNYELESELERKGKIELLKIVRAIVPQHVKCIYIRQPQALGLGHAVLCARPIVGEEPFAVILADDLIDGRGHPCLKQMVELFSHHGQSLLAVEEIAASETDKYGIIDPGGTDSSVELFPIQNLIEKPAPSKAPSNLAVIGRYILTSRVMALLETIPKGSGGEIQLTDAIARLLLSESVLAYRFKGIRYDCGSKLGYLQATVAYGLKHEECNQGFQAYLKSLNL